MSRDVIYTHGHHDSVLRSHRWRTAANSAAYLLPRLASASSLLDVGCGPGTITTDLAQALPGGRVVGVDQSPAAIEEASARAAAKSIDTASASISFELGDVYGLPFENGEFDVVHAHQVLQHLGDPVAALREMRRVCRPGGTVAARDGDYAAMTWFPVNPGLERWLELYRALAHANGAEPDAGRRLLSWAHASGFSEVVTSASVWCFASPDDRAWWGGLWADRILHSSVADQLIERKMSSADELEELAAAWRQFAQEPDGFFAIVHGEVLCAA